MHAFPPENKGYDSVGDYCDENHKKKSRSEDHKSTLDLTANPNFGAKKPYYNEIEAGTKEKYPVNNRKTTLDKAGLEASSMTSLLGRHRFHQSSPSDSNKEFIKEGLSLSLPGNLAAGSVRWTEKMADLLGTTAHAKTTGGPVWRRKKR